MSALLPLSVTVSAKRRACVLDTDLALSRHGLLLALRICEEIDLWLVRELWQILDNTSYYLEHPESLSASRAAGQDPPADDHDRELIRDVLSQWELARIESDLGGLNIFWVGDARSESFLPKGTDPNLVVHFESLAASLENRIDRMGGAISTESVHVDCFRDAAALTAALTPYQGFILTRCPTNGNGKTGEPPAICSYLDRLGIAQCKPPAAEHLIQQEKDLLWPIFTRTGVTELMWDGLSPVVVHILAPKSILIPWAAKASETYADGLEFNASVQEPVDWWKDAKYYWYPL